MLNSLPKEPDRVLTDTIGGKPIMLFDGVCNLCSFWVRFAIARDPAARLRFAPVQSDLGQDFLRRRNLPTDLFESFYLIEEGQVYEKSTAFLRMVRHLRGPWPLLQAARIVPTSVRDWLYDRIARNRYRLFGRRDSCLMPSPDVASRFLT
jgi:predicted DCC family thiol-disulfide oxidoreductase YuxK